MALAAVVVARIVAAVWAAIWNIRGDYYASLPGAYVRTVNPTLWNSPDMAGAWGYQADTYFHGPSQYLTLYPVAYLDSYAAIARVLLPIYAIVVAAAFWLLRSVCRQIAPELRDTIPFLAATFLFFPLLQAYIQREFEIMVLLGLSAALWLLVRERHNAAAAALAYVAWFKYVPLVFAGYLGLRRWYPALGAFALMSVAILAIAHTVFGLGLFINNNVPAHAAQVFNLWSYGFERGRHEYFVGTGFCYGWIESETTLSNVRHALCSLSFRAPWLPPHLTYVALCVGVAVSYLTTHVRFERQQHVAANIEHWRRALEFSIVTTVSACFFFNHYYYLIVLVIPLNVLLARYLTTPQPRRLVAWAVAYVLLSAFVIPTSVLSSIFDVDAWAMYIKGAWFLWGELILIGLLLLEYRELASGRSLLGQGQVKDQTDAQSKARPLR